MSTTMANVTATPTAEPAATETQPKSTILQLVARFIRPAIGLTILFTILTGIFYPLVITGLAQAFFPSQANGSLVTKNGQTIASAIIGQNWTQPQYFHGRPSATTYAADSSGGSNLGPTNSALLTEVQKNTDLVRKENPDVPDTTPIPVDMVTSSASGIDPDISVAAAYYQIARVAKARGMTQDQVRALIDSHIQGRFLGIFGEPRINVLALNQALDRAQGK
jgi:potassium-transporting ATPase KdpC subunit